MKSSDEQILAGTWNQIKGTIRKEWGDFRDDELDQFKGNSQALLGYIQEKTGRSRKALEARFNEMVQQARARRGT